MKRLYTLFLLACCVVGLVGCSDSEETEVTGLKVEKSDVSYDASGGEGVIEISSTETLTATSSEDWCTVAVEGNLIRLTVKQNYDVSSRSAMIDIRTAASGTQVAIYQLGNIISTDMENQLIAGSGGEFTFHAHALAGVEVTSSVDWITCNMDGENVVVKVEPLAVGTRTGIRTGTVTLSSGPILKLEHVFSQVNMGGEFDCYRTVNGVQEPYGTCTLEATEDPSLYRVWPNGSLFDGPYYINYSDGSFIIAFSQTVVGTFMYEGTLRNVVLCAYDARGFFSADTSVQYVAPVAFDKETGAMTLAFQDNGTWPGGTGTVDGLYYSITDVNGVPSGTGWSVVNLVWIRK